MGETTENDPYKVFSEEHIEKWCKENDFPVNYFKMTVDEQRIEVYENWKRRSH